MQGTEILSSRKPFQEGNGKQKANNHRWKILFSKNFQRSRVTQSIHPSDSFKRAGEDSEHHSTVSKWAQPTEWTRYSVFIRTEEFSLLQVLFHFSSLKSLCHICKRNNQAIIKMKWNSCILNNLRSFPFRGRPGSRTSTSKQGAGSWLLSSLRQKWHLQVHTVTK